MAYTITTRDGITIPDIPDELAPDSPEVREMVRVERERRANESATAQNSDIPLVPGASGYEEQLTANTAPQEPQRSMVDTAIAGAGELAGGINRPVQQLMDVPANFVNSGLDILDQSGVMESERRLPTLRDSMWGSETGDFLGEGTAANILSGAGEVASTGLGVGTALRQGVQALTPLARAGEGTVRGVIRNLGSTTPVQDVGYGAASGLGMELGQDMGGEVAAIIGSIVAPLGYGAIAKPITRLLERGASGVTQLVTSFSTLSEKAAAEMLAQAMIKEGLSPNEILAKMKTLGPEGLPADISNSFARLLKEIANKIPRIEGQANIKFNARQEGQFGRLSSALDFATGTPGLNSADEIARLRLATTPKINQLYAEAGEQSMGFSPRLTKLFEGDNSLGRARKAANLRLADRRAAGEQITNISVVDATKQELDDQINTALRLGENNKVRDLVKLKNVMVREADASIPVYKEARTLFAGQAALESAEKQGQDFFKLSPRELNDIISSMGESELRMFRLGVKEIFIKKALDSNVNRNLVGSLFEKGKSKQMLRSIFPNNRAYKTFMDTLERESNFILTRNSVKGGSNSAKNLYDMTIGSSTAFAAARAAAGDPIAGVGVFAKVLEGLSKKKGSQEYESALNIAGDFLLNESLDPKKVMQVIADGNAESISRLLKKYLVPESFFTNPTIRSSAAAEVNTLSPQEQQ